MNKLRKLCRNTLAIALAFCLVCGLCVNALTAFATGGTDAESRKDAILNEFFGEGVTADEAYAALLENTKEMESYENLLYQYVKDEDSYYVALGDETAATTKRVTSTYVDQLAAKLDVPFLNLAASQMTIQDAYAAITENADEIAKADLISIGWSNYSATYYMCQYMWGKADRVTESQWKVLVGEENMPLLNDLLDQMFKKLRDNNISNFDGYDLEGGLECYAYAYMSNVIHQPQVIEAIRVINTDAVILLVGTYNDLENISLSANGSEFALGDMMQDFVNASNWFSTKNAAAYSRVAYVDAPDVDTTMDKKASGYSTPQQYVLAIIGREGLPNSDGHAYIAKQINGVLSDKCVHTWDEGVVTTDPTCQKEGVKTYTCTWCEETKTEAVPATGEHNWDEGEVTKAPTSTADGEKTYTCKDCGEKKTEVIEKTGETELLVGDVNGDGNVNARDARTLLRYLAGMEELSEANMAAADFDGNGNVNARDARAILRYLANLN